MFNFFLRTYFEFNTLNTNPDINVLYTNSIRCLTLAVRYHSTVTSLTLTFEFIVFNTNPDKNVLNTNPIRCLTLAVRYRSTIACTTPTVGFSVFSTYLQTYFHYSVFTNNRNASDVLEETIKQVFLQVSTEFSVMWFVSAASKWHLRGRTVFISVYVQGDSVARSPKLLSIKNYVIEIMTWKWKMKIKKKRCKTGPAHNRCWNWSPFTSKHTWMRFSKFWNTFPKFVWGL